MQRWESARRYYVVIVAPNLLGPWELIQAGGGKGSRLGVALKQRKRGDAILCLRHFRRYMLVSPSSAMLQFTTWMVGAPLIGAPRTLL